jgi:orotate phosphoribosyltransferase-like protein
MINEERVLELYNEGLTDREISEELKIPQQSVVLWRKRNKLEANTIIPKNDRLSADFDLLASLGYDAKQIASACVVSEPSYKRWKRS